MSINASTWRATAALGAVLLISACALDQPRGVASAPAAAPPREATNPPPVRPGPAASWFHVGFDNDSVVIGDSGQKVVSDVSIYLHNNPNAVATIIGRTDTVGSQQYNVHLSHQRADAVRDALVYANQISADRVETRWTGEDRQKVPTTDNVPEAANREVDIAIH